jgi:hypothetical protein
MRVIIDTYVPGLHADGSAITSNRVYPQKNTAEGLMAILGCFSSIQELRPGSKFTIEIEEDWK